MKYLIMILVLFLALTSVQCGEPDYQRSIEQALDDTQTNWHQIFSAVAVDGLNTVFMCSDTITEEIVENPTMAEEIARLCLDITVDATDGDLSRTDVITKDGIWLADADLNTVTGQITVENYIKLGQKLIYPDFAKLFK